MNDSELEVMLNRAAEKGAEKALKSIGLSDEMAVHDVHELRGLLDAWRQVKTGVSKRVVQFLTVGTLGALSAVWYFKS